MDIYTCPMHPEVQQHTKGICPKCGMRLVLENSVTSGVDKGPEKSYLPLAVIVGLILLTTLVISLRDLQANLFSPTNSLTYFMTGFFLVFAGFKLMDLKGFAQGYSTYDLLAKKWYPYGYIYPFIELFFGLAMILSSHSTILLWTELTVMTFSGLGVALKLLKGERFQCACLGTFLKVPLTKITLIEDFGMAILAGIMLLIK